MIKDREPKPRVREADRSQSRMVILDLETLIAEDDPARAVWSFVEHIDLSDLYGKIAAVEGGVGRPAIDPKILLALWLQATLDGVGSSRELARLCEQHVRYQWICGGVTPNYHTLSDFRSNSASVLDRILTESVAVLLKEGLVKMNRVAQDGMRVRASAGASSFRRGSTLKELHRIAEEQVELLREELEQDAGAGKRRQKAAEERAAADRLKRIERALEQMPEAEKRKQARNGKKKSEARVSTTDPDARVMKMADGGFRPAFNVQYATDTESKCIIGVDVTNAGTDRKLAQPMLDRIEQRYDRIPSDLLVDGGYIHLEEIESITGRGCRVFTPPRKPGTEDRTPTDIRARDSEAVASWRERMESDEGKAIYKERAATAELVNAQARNRGLGQFLVRGLERVRSVALLHALTQNLRSSLHYWVSA